MEKIYHKIVTLYEQHWWLTPLTMFLVWRLGLELVGRTTLAFTSPIASPWSAEPHPPMWARWDSGWYSAILSYGYQLRHNLMSDVTFFPLYPLLWKIVWTLTSLRRLAAGVLTANIMTAAASLTFYRWVSVAHGATMARRALALLLIFPASFFLAAAYSESTFIFLLAFGLLAAERQRWGTAALLAALVSATRPVGIALWPALLTMWWSANSTHKQKSTGALLLVVPPLGLAAFSLYLWQVTGDPLAWLHAQAMAARGYVFPLKLLASYAHNILTGGEFWLLHLGELAALGFAAALLPKLWRKNHGQAVLVLGLLLPPIFTNTLASYPRFTLVALPLFVTLAQVKQRWLIWAYATISLPLLAFGVYRFVTWRWAG